VRDEFGVPHGARALNGGPVREKEDPARGAQTTHPERRRQRKEISLWRAYSLPTVLWQIGRSRPTPPADS